MKDSPELEAFAHPLLTDTQADLTERARAVFNAWMRSRPADTYQSSIMATEAMRLIDLYAAFAQSEREAAAAEARRLRDAIIEARQRLAKGQPPGHPCHECDLVLEAALASPPAPQEETR